MTFTPGSDAANALDDDVLKAPWVGFLDFLGDPVRATTWKAPLAFAADETGDEDLDEQTFSAVDHELISVGEIRQTERGSQPIQVRLSGLITIDNDLLNTIGDRSNWVGRKFRLWRLIFDETGEQVGVIAPFYTGFMTQIVIEPKTEQQHIVVTANTFRASFTQAHGRTYMDQAYYDAGDLSADAVYDLLNGTSGNPLVNNIPGAAQNPDITRLRSVIEPGGAAKR